jgi:hypothetical protein
MIKTGEDTKARRQQRTGVASQGFQQGLGEATTASRLLT